jgi:hypothetical protein
MLPIHEQKRTATADLTRPLTWQKKRERVVQHLPFWEGHEEVVDWRRAG